MRYLRWLLLLVFLILVCALAVSVDAACWCGGSTVNFREVDGAPFGSYHTVIVPNDTLADNGDQTATFTPSGGAGGISGATANGALYATSATTATSTAALTDGQLLIGDTGAVPIAATLTGTANHVTVTNGAGAITLNVGSDVVQVDVANSWADGVKQTFNPNATTAGLNVGSQAGDPSSLANGDLWYDSTANELTARINGANVALGAAGAGGVTLTGAETLSNKKIIPRKTALSAASGTVTAPNCDVAGSDTYFRDDIAGALTIPAATGTCHDGQRLMFELKPATAQQAVTFTTGVSKGFSAQAGLPLPTTTGDSTTYVLYAFIYKAATDRFHYAGGTAAATVRSIYFSAGAMEVSGGCAAIAPAALVTNGPKLPTIGCTDTDADSIEFDVVMPDGWDGGTLTMELVAFSIGNNTTEVFEMDFAFQCVSTGDTPAAHSTAGEQAATITWGNTANREQHATTAAVTGNGTCAPGDHVYVRGQVDATATTMTPMSDLKILGVKLEYARSGGND